jgi:hypothetical protein
VLAAPPAAVAGGRGMRSGRQTQGVASDTNSDSGSEGEEPNPPSTQDRLYVETDTGLRLKVKAINLEAVPPLGRGAGQGEGRGEVSGGSRGASMGRSRQESLDDCRANGVPEESLGGLGGFGGLGVHVGEVREVTGLVKRPELNGRKVRVIGVTRPMGEGGARGEKGEGGPRVQVHARGRALTHTHTPLPPSLPLACSASRASSPYVCTRASRLH